MKDILQRIIDWQTNQGEVGALPHHVLINDCYNVIKKQQEQEIKAKVDKSTLDESPSAYKDIFEVMKMQEELVDVSYHVKPLINIKGAGKEC